MCVLFVLEVYNSLRQKKLKYRILQLKFGNEEPIYKCLDCWLQNLSESLQQYSTSFPCFLLHLSYIQKITFW